MLSSTVNEICVGMKHELRVSSEAVLNGFDTGEFPPSRTAASSGCSQDYERNLNGEVEPRSTNTVRDLNTVFGGDQRGEHGPG